MNENKFFKALCSLPIILIAFYFIPFIGVCLVLFRYFIYRNDKYYKTPMIILIFGLLVLIPKGIDSILKIFKMEGVEIPYLDTIITSDFYSKMLGYSKLLITVGILFLILSFLFKSLFHKLSSKLNTGIRNYMEQDLQKDYEIRKANDLKMQEKREKAKNTHVVCCPYCGSDNMLTEQTGTCKFCRRKIEYKS